MVQKATEFKPTRKERLLLDALLDPKNRMKSISDICTIAQCGRNTYYRAMEKTEFVKYYKNKSKELVDQNIGPIVSAFVKEAKRGSYPHGKVLLEMAGLYQDKKLLKIAGEITENINNMTEDERKKRREDLKKKMQDSEDVNSE